MLQPVPRPRTLLDGGPSSFADLPVQLLEESGPLPVDVEDRSAQRGSGGMVPSVFLPEKLLDSGPPGLHFFCIDDSDVACKLLEHSIRRHCKEPKVTVGTFRSKVAEFVPRAMCESANICVIDQHLDYSPTEQYLGTDLIKALLASGFDGLLCIRSANVATYDVQLYRASGAHYWVGKEVPMRETLECIIREYVRRFRSEG